MCGIIGYCGPRAASDVLLAGLKRLEYRGYDSAGISVGHNSSLQIFKKEGKIRVLRDAVPEGVDGPMGHRAYALGHPWRSQRHQCSSSPRLHGENRYLPQRYYRKLRRLERETHR
jgi:glucosamine--fructose-6-phosphate aminotransferase (isomerizing)